MISDVIFTVEMAVIGYTAVSIIWLYAKDRLTKWCGTNAR